MTVSEILLFLQYQQHMGITLGALRPGYIHTCREHLRKSVLE